MPFQSAISTVTEAVNDQISVLQSTWQKLVTVWGSLAALGLVALSLVDRHVGGFSPNMQILFKLQVVGFCLGTLAAALGKGKHHPTFRSDVGIKGATRKGAMWGWIWLMHQVDMTFGFSLLRDGLVIAYNIYEASSIAETYVNLGWYGHKAVEGLLVWRLEGLKQWALDRLKPKEGQKDDNRTGT